MLPGGVQADRLVELHHDRRLNPDESRAVVRRDVHHLGRHDAELPLIITLQGIAIGIGERLAVGTGLNRSVDHDAAGQRLRRREHIHGSIEPFALAFHGLTVDAQLHRLWEIFRRREIGERHDRPIEDHGDLGGRFGIGSALGRNDLRHF